MWIAISLIGKNKVNVLQNRINNCFQAETIITSIFKSQVQEDVEYTNQYEQDNCVSSTKAENGSHVSMSSNAIKETILCLREQQ